MIVTDIVKDVINVGVFTSWAYNPVLRARMLLQIINANVRNRLFSLILRTIATLKWLMHACYLHSRRI
jgi:hypothetical protein